MTLFHVPESILGYKHIPQEIWYDLNNYKYIYCNDIKMKIKLFKFLWTLLVINNHLYYLNISLSKW